MEFTKRKLSVSGKLPYIFATTAPPYRLTGETILSYGSETGGQDWPAITNEEREANAKELVRRWNSHEDLLVACKYGQRLLLKGIGQQTHAVAMFEAAIASAEA